jgi:hypothetical protein
MEAAVNELGPRARAFIDRVGGSDGPPAGTRERMRAGFGAALAAGALGTSATALGASSGKSAAAAGLWGLTGKGSASIALCLLLGGAAGVAVTTPVAFLVHRAPSPAASARASEPAQQEPAARVALARGGEVPREATAPVPASVVDIQAPTRAAPVIGTVSTTAVRSAAPHENPPSAPPTDDTPIGVFANPAPSSAMATELSLLKSAQRELNAGNASASLALLDEHARRYPGGALRVERLGARVFALCQLGRVDAARVAAREFLDSATDSPLVPRVLSSCAGSGANGTR